MSARTGRVLNFVMVMQPTLAVITIAVLIFIGWLSVYLAGGEGYAPPHWFYFPILLAATRFGARGVLVTALVSGIVAGPLMPMDVELDVPQAVSDESIRTLYFIVIGTFMAGIIWRLKRALAQEAEVAAHKAAVISSVSHEFRTPLSVVLGSSKLLLHEREWPEKERVLLECISGSARQLNDLVAGVLAISEGTQRAERSAFQHVPLADVVTAVGTGTSPADAGRLHVDVGHLVVVTDPPILEALLRHLVDNALRFSPKRSQVEITAGASDGEPSRVRIVVADRGPGIDDRFLPAAFEPFTQQDASRTRESGGLGIGLFVVRRLTDYLEAELDLRHRPGGGTEACVELHGMAGVTIGSLPTPLAEATDAQRA